MKLETWLTHKINSIYSRGQQHERIAENLDAHFTDSRDERQSSMADWKVEYIQREVAKIIKYVESKP